MDVKQLYLRRQSIIGAAGTNPLDVETALEAARSIIARCLCVRAAEAHRIVEANQTAGKIVLDPTVI